MFYSTNQSYHWILNQWDDRIQCPATNENRVTYFTSASEQYIRWQNRHWYSGFFDRPWPCSPVRNAAKYLQRREALPDLKRPMQIPHRPIPVGYAAKSSAEQTPETDMKRPTTTAWPAAYAIYKYPGGVYHTTQNIFDRLEDEGIDVPEEDRYYPYRATYDIEVMLQPTDKRRSEKLEWTSHHVSATLYQTGDFR